MPVLRSREILPLPNPSSSPKKTLGIGILEPKTPSKTTESLTNQTSSTTKFEPDSALMSAPPPRRSSRLAAKPTLSVSPATKRRRSGSVVKKTEFQLPEVENVSVEESSVRVSDLVVEGSPKKVRKVDDSDCLEVENRCLSLRSGTKVVRKESEEPKNDAEKGKGKGKAILIEEDDDDCFEIEGKMEEVKSPRRRFSKEEKGKSVMSSERLSREEKEKGLMSEIDCELDDVELDLAANVDLDSEMMVDFLNKFDVDVDVDVHENVSVNETKNVRDRFKDIARRNAAKYAHFNAEEEEGNHVNEEDESVSDEDEPEMATEQPTGNVEDWPGPFSTAMKIIRDREKNLKSGVKNSSSEKGRFPLVSWIRKERDPECWKRAPPSLQILCLKILEENVDAITSLESVPDELRNRLSQMLCDSRKMNLHFLSLLLDGSPSEIHLADCSWLEEHAFEKSFEACNIKNLKVLQLDLCGHCVSDSSLRKALVPKGLKTLTTISLKGGCRISDAGLAELVASAPALRSMNLSQCSLLTDVGLDSIAESLGSILQELYLDDCYTLGAMSILPKLMRLKKLELLSLRGVATVSDKFIRKLIRENGQNMKELVLANCINLTDSSLKVIADTCSQLRVLDISCLGKLTDIGMAYITNGCRNIQHLKLCRSPFSDDAIAAFLETSGESLKELSLNNISKVGQNTTISLARRCKNLEFLDLSWCRLLTDEALGLIADSCWSLRLLKIFGCTQVTNIFSDGHSNPHLHIVGRKLTPILEHIKRPFQQESLYYPSAPGF
ncbi:hypothetical protein SOVF_041280 [Spinacia oleracea]|uniref:F-box/LRR-repeat protein 15-like leucin rich repeat domain-containing protein n=1 Tax=Spinacia oleracea TaxID=3562 RepID=A0A9R0HWL2_SPIOL|nr:uncharacterized protein LOC110778137 [Spinacia oleracea]KNA21656.1 hypothetical protein SOVF_041280 [Spinacia oleracea]